MEAGEPLKNGHVDRTHAYFLGMVGILIIVAIVFLVALNLENDVANVVAGGLTVSLLEVVKALRRSGSI